MPSLDDAGARLVVDLGAIVANYHLIRDRLRAAEAAVVVKDDAYGLGVEAVAPALAAAGGREFFGARPDEGAALRRLVPEARIFVLNGVAAEGETGFLEHGLLPVLNSPEQARAWRAAAGRLGRTLPAALHIDTGMNRLGMAMAEFQERANDPQGFDGITVDLLMSHLACADDPDHPMNAAQHDRFETAWHVLPPAARATARRSLANSSGVFLGPAYHYEQVRIGAALYGVNPQPAHPNPMRQVVRLQAPVIQVRSVDPGSTVGYGAAHRVRGAGRIAIVPIGYANGLWRSLGDRIRADIAGIPVPVVGRISMDLTTIDVSDLAPGHVRVGTMVDLIGDTTTIDEVARVGGSIAYEVLTGLGRLLPRNYVDGMSSG